MRIFATGILPVLLYSSETWTYSQIDLNALECFQMRCLRRILGVTLMDRLRNSEIRQRCCSQPTIEEQIRANRMRWMGHLSRMGNERIPKRVWVSDRPSGWRIHPTASRLSWQRHLERDLQLAGLQSTKRSSAITTAREMAQNRKQWRAVIRDVKHQPGPAQ